MERFSKKSIFATLFIISIFSNKFKNNNSNDEDTPVLLYLIFILYLNLDYTYMNIYDLDLYDLYLRSSISIF